MIDRKKVIMGLECCQECDGYTCRNCCPYHDRNEPEDQSTCTCHLAHDALALLKAQEPRVLVLGEIHRGMAVWLEDVDKSDMILAIGGSSAGGTKCFITENDVSTALLDAEYNVRWRAWTAKPTE